MQCPQHKHASMGPTPGQPISQAVLLPDKSLCCSAAVAKVAKETTQLHAWGAQHACAAVHHRRPGLRLLQALDGADKVAEGLRGGGNAMVWPGMVVKVCHLQGRTWTGN